MNRTAALLAALTLVGCASNDLPQVEPPKTTQQDLVIDKKIPAMSRNEVIIAVKECESSGLRAVVIHGKRKIGEYTADVVVDVTCAPRFNF
jgi:uncharacterized protein YcfL